MKHKQVKNPLSHVKTAYTPSPWEISDNDDNVVTIHAKLPNPFGWTCIADVHANENSQYTGNGFHPSKAEMRANARLIAAAPETAAERDRLKEVNEMLLEAAKYAARPDVSRDFWLTPLLCAIAKAESK